MPRDLTIPEILRSAIADSGLSSTAIAERAGLDRRQVDRFLAGDRDLRFEAAGRIIQAIGLELRQPIRPKGRPAKKPKSGD